jgi:hypothetical protein
VYIIKTKGRKLLSFVVFILGRKSSHNSQGAVECVEERETFPAQRVLGLSLSLSVYTHTSRVELAVYRAESTEPDQMKKWWTHHAMRSVYHPAYMCVCVYKSLKTSGERERTRLARASTRSITYKREKRSCLRRAGDERETLLYIRRDHLLLSLLSTLLHAAVFRGCAPTRSSHDLYGKSVCKPAWVRCKPSRPASPFINGLMQIPFFFIIISSVCGSIESGRDLFFCYLSIIKKRKGISCVFVIVFLCVWGGEEGGIWMGGVDCIISL